MDKRKLIQIIEKELEELKVLSEEIAENEDDTSLIINLALSKARLLCQEIELMREITAKEAVVSTDDSPVEDEEEWADEVEDEVSDVSVSDPELEIVNFEEKESEEEDTTSLDDENEDVSFQEDELDSEDLDEDEPEIDEDDETDDDLTEDEADDRDEGEQEFDEEEVEKEGLIEFGEDNNETEEEIDEYKKYQPTVEHTILETEPQPGIREITIDDMEDDDLEPVKIVPEANVADRPVMREIPKPEELIPGKKVVGEPFHKEPSLNDSISESKTGESPLTSGSISSLRAAIGLNDRFLFIREIFANNTDKYNSVIDQLDKLETQQQAVELLKANISLQKNETSMKFVDLLKRRFSK